MFAAGFTLFSGGIGGALEAEGADPVIRLEWGGILFSVLTIVLGAVCLTVEKRFVAILLILCALVGAFMGGTIVAVFMALALIGGIQAAFEKDKKKQET